MTQWAQQTNRSSKERQTTSRFADKKISIIDAGWLDVGTYTLLTWDTNFEYFSAVISGNVDRKIQGTRASFKRYTTRKILGIGRGGCKISDPRFCRFSSIGIQVPFPSLLVWV